MERVRTRRLRLPLPRSPRTLRPPVVALRPSREATRQPAKGLRDHRRIVQLTTDLEAATEVRRRPVIVARQKGMKPARLWADP